MTKARLLRYDTLKMSNMLLLLVISTTSNWITVFYGCFLFQSMFTSDSGDIQTSFKFLTLSNNSSGTLLLFTLAALWISFVAFFFLPWVMSQRADSGTILVDILVFN